MKKKGDAAIIFCNDSAQFVVIGNDAAAKKKLNELRKADKHKHVKEWHVMDAEKYERIFIWHIKYADYDVIK